MPSDAFLAAIRHSGVTKVDVLHGGGAIGSLSPVSGSVTLDANSEIRGTVELTLADPDGSLVPTSADDLIAPYGNELYVSRGVRHLDGSDELVSLGKFRIGEVTADETGMIRVTGEDRAIGVSDAKLERPLNIRKGTLFTDAILSLVERAIGDLQFDFPDIDVTTPGLIAEEGDDPWSLAQGLAKAIGHELFFDRDGVLVLRLIPQPLDEPAMLLVEGDGGLLVAASKTWSRADAFNRVIVTSETADATPGIRGMATDLNPDSPTYYYGPFGKVPKLWSNAYVFTSAQCQLAANGILVSQLGIGHTINFGAVVNPALAPGDVVQVTRDQLGVNEAHVIDQVTIPLDVESPMTGDTRLVFAIDVGAAVKPDHLLLSPETLLSPDQVMY